MEISKIKGFLPLIHVAFLLALDNKKKTDLIALSCGETKRSC